MIGKATSEMANLGPDTLEGVHVRTMPAPAATRQLVDRTEIKLIHYRRSAWEWGLECLQVFEIAPQSSKGIPAITKWVRDSAEPGPGFGTYFIFLWRTSHPLPAPA
jgi:hypothetical protein